MAKKDKAEITEIETETTEVPNFDLTKIDEAREAVKNNLWDADGFFDRFGVEP